ncbi:MAG: hypothetical protein J6A74_06835 [Oscillospiraceae bacterium]|nr:hypothetical protein [Oscillospiraceae bacterium]
MAKRVNRYKKMEQYMTATLLADLFLFILYLIAAGTGTLWLKVLTAIFTILISGLCLAYLYLTKELLRPRSLWMTAAAGSILLCVIASLILGFPSPSPYANDAITAARQFLL